MRKGLGLALVAALALGALAAPHALAGTKTVKKKFTAGPHVPAPVLSEVDENGCLNSVEGVNKTTVEYHTPAKGTLTAKISNFEGDWDLYVTDANGNVIGSSHGDQTTGGVPNTEQVVVRLGKNKHTLIVACDWAGTSQTADGSYTYKYKT
jgi:hypothetical protein